MIGHRYLRTVRRGYKFHDREDRCCLRYANVGRVNDLTRLAHKEIHSFRTGSSLG